MLIWKGTLIGRKTLRLIMTVNNKTAQGIFFSRCILGLLKDKVCVLVTHQLQYLKDGTSILCLKEVSASVLPPTPTQSTLTSPRTQIRSAQSGVQLTNQWATGPAARLINTELFQLLVKYTSVYKGFNKVPVSAVLSD